MSRARDKGTRWESAIVEFLRPWFPHVERRAGSGARDRGDISGLTGWVLEAKSTKTLDLASAIDEARAEAANAGTAWYAAVIKRRNQPTRRGYVVLELEVFARLLADLDQDGDPR